MADLRQDCGFLSLPVQLSFQSVPPVYTCGTATHEAFTEDRPFDGSSLSQGESNARDLGSSSEDGSGRMRSQPRRIDAAAGGAHPLRPGRGSLIEVRSSIKDVEAVAVVAGQ